ncbi:MAG: HAD family hydrolase, partial [Bacteroidota bacterium]
MVQIEMVVFDMAGTTVNENNIVYKTVQKCI